MIKSEEELTLEEIDEALGFVAVSLKDRYGNRLTHQQKTLYLNILDSLLDKRLALTSKPKLIPIPMLDFIPVPTLDFSFIDFDEIETNSEDLEH